VDIQKNQDDFNIPKLHSMQHYVAAIISQGFANSYSTKRPEHLHIDFAKSAYWASNKKNYIKQMTKWLSHQEACHFFANYLQWTIPGYVAELVSKSKDDDEELEEDKADNVDDYKQDLQLKYSIAKQLAYPHIKISSVTDDFGAVDFLLHFTKFLQDSPHMLRSASAPQPPTCLHAFKCFTNQLPPAPQVTKLVTKDIICARCAVPTHSTSLASTSPIQHSISETERCWQEFAAST
jgi:hypothetical protein